MSSDEKFVASNARSSSWIPDLGVMFHNGDQMYRLPHGIVNFDLLKMVHVVIGGYSYKAVIRQVLDNHIVVYVNGKNAIVKKTNTFR